MEALSAVLHAANILLLLGLLFIYVQNYRHVRNRITAGMLLFVAFFLAQGMVGLYFDLSMVMYYSKQAETVAFALEGIKTVGFLLLLWVSWE